MSPCEVVRKRRSVVVEEKGVVGERTHGNANLTSKCDANREGMFFAFMCLPDRCSTGTEGQALFCNDDALSFIATAEKREELIATR